VRFGSVLPGKCDGTCSVWYSSVEPERRQIRQGRGGESRTGLQKQLFGFFAGKRTRFSVSEEVEAAIEPGFGDKCVSLVHEPERDSEEHTHANCATAVGESTRLLGLHGVVCKGQLALDRILTLFRTHRGRRSGGVSAVAITRLIATAYRAKLPALLINAPASQSVHPTHSGYSTWHVELLLLERLRGGFLVTRCNPSLATAESAATCFPDGDQPASRRLPGTSEPSGECPQKQREEKVELSEILWREPSSRRSSR
jgi:hypothetical protein